jgi:hypothetical protein
MSLKRKIEDVSFRQEKPEDCPICTEKIGDEDILECGHWIHISCVKKHFKPECPVCRKSLNIEVEGSRPGGDLGEEVGEEVGGDLGEEVPEEIRRELIQIAERVREQFEEFIPIIVYVSVENENVLERNVIERGNEENYEFLPELEEQGENEDNEEWRKKGYLYREEDEDYDEENPDGDNVNYD